MTRMAPTDLWLSFLRGGYPELVASPIANAPLWHSSYVQTYLERDVRSLRQVGDLLSFQSFLAHLPPGPANCSISPTSRATLGSR